MTKENQQLAFEYAKTVMPREACGVVIIEKGIEVFVPCKNISEFHDMFEIDPLEYAAAEDRGEVVEIFHSHCYASPMPSMVDKTVCQETKLKWSIVSVPNNIWYEHTPDGYKAPLVGRQWAHGHLDCYNLIQDYYREKLNINLPDFKRDFEWWHKGENLYMQNFEAVGFKAVDPASIKEHDIILMQILSPVVNHGGIYLGHKLMLHHLHRRLSGRDVYEGYYRKHTNRVVRHFSL